MMNKARLVFFTIITFALFSSFILAATKPIQKQHTDVQARYFYSAETVYRLIEIDGLKLKVTTFKDADKKCQNWIEQRPCWTEKDLVTKETKLTKKDLTALTNLINQSEFLLLEKTYGGAPQGQRFYPETIRVKLGEVQHEVTYQSFPEAKPRPEAFIKVAKWLETIARRKTNR
ncbi:MAG: hypothetical protein AB1757_00555 [Acidobacteriota bacterium]